jgi:hypothetical protein
MGRRAGAKEEEMEGTRRGSLGDKRGVVKKKETLSSKVKIVSRLCSADLLLIWQTYLLREKIYVLIDTIDLL